MVVSRTDKRKLFAIGDKVSWLDNEGIAQTGFVVSVEYLKAAGIWLVWATWNGKPYHPITNPGPMYHASAQRFRRAAR